MYLPAITVGYAVPVGNFDASIHSVFRSALNLCPVEGDSLLTLVRSSEPDLPQGIRLDSPEDFSFEGFQIGEPTVCRDGILSFENPRLTVQLSSAQRWECDLSKLEVDTTDPRVAADWSLIWDALNKRQKRLNAEIIGENLFHPDKTASSSVSYKISKAVCDLVDATRRFDRDGIFIVQSLIGLGSGLTPDGDDMLIGYLAGLWCTVQGRSDRARFTADLGKSIVDLSNRTNDISRTYLLHATRGQVSSRLTALMEAISHGEEADRLLEIAHSAMQTGHTSGMAAVAGLLIGIAVWNTSDYTNRT